MKDFERILRRKYVAIATAEFDADAYPDLPKVHAEVALVTGWLTDKKLKTRAFTQDFEKLAGGPKVGDIEDCFRDVPWDESHAAVVYVTGHGDKGSSLGRERHFLVLGATDPTRLPATAFPLDQLLDWLSTTDIDYLLIIIDVCFAGLVTEDFAGAGENRHWLILPSTQKNKEAEVGALTTAISQYLDRAAEYNTHSPHLTVGMFTEALNELLPEEQRVERIYKGKRPGRDGDPGDNRERHVCLPNPSYDPQDELLELEPALQELALREDFLDIHNRVGDSMPSADSPGWLFTGRERLMRELVEAAGKPGVTMVTGSAGSGKSTVLSRLVTLSDHNFRLRYEHELIGMPDDMLPDPGLVNAAISAQGRTNRQVVTQLRFDLGAPLTLASWDDPVLANRAAVSDYLARSEKPVTIVIDALDQGDRSRELVTTVLAPLAREHPEKLCLLLGVRSPGGVNAGEEPLTDLLEARLIAADDDLYWTEADLLRFTSNLLVNTPKSLYRNADPSAVIDIATVIGGSAGRSYLMAKMAANSVATRAVVAPDDPEWRNELKNGLLGVFRGDLWATLPDSGERRRAVALLRAVAFARGNGLPRHLVWPKVANAVDASDGAGGTYGDDGVKWLLRSRLSAYLTTGLSTGQQDDLTVYRLIHDELRDILRERWQELLADDKDPVPAPADKNEIRDVEARIAKQLHVLVDEDPTVAVNAAIPSYVRRHLAEHAFDGDVLRRNVPVPFLPYIDLTRLRAAIGASPVRRQLDETVPWLPVIQQVTHLWDWYRTARNATAIDMWAILNEIRLPGSGIEPGPAGGPWQVRWAIRPPDMGNVLGRHRDTVRAVATAELSDGPVAVTGGLDGLLHVWDLSTGAHFRDREPIATTRDSGKADVADERRAIASVGTARLWSGRTVAVTGSADGFIRVWDLASWRALGDRLGDGCEKIEAVTTAVLPDGRVVVSAADATGTVRTWDLDSRQQVGAQLDCGSGMALGLGTALVFGRLLGLATGEDSGLQLWDLATGEPVGGRLTGHPLAVEEPGTGTLQGGRAVAAVTLDGEDIAITGNGDGLLLWDLGKRAPISQRLRGGDGAIRTLATARVGDLVMAVTGGNRAVQLWDVAAGEPIGELLTGHEGSVEAVAIGAVSGGSAFAVSVSRDASVRLWDVPGAARTPRRPSREIGIVESVTTARPRQGPAVAITCSDSTAQVWDLERGGDPVELTAYDSPVVSVAAAELPDGVLVVGGHWDGSTSTWRAADGTLVRRGQLGNIGAAASLATATLDGRLLAVAGGWDGDVHIWDPITATRIGEPLRGHADVVVALAIATTAEGRTLVVSGGRDGSVRIRDLGAHVNPDNPAPRQPVIIGIGGEVASLTVTQLVDGQRCVVVGGEDGKVRLFGLLDGAPLPQAWQASGAAVAAVVAGRLPDGRVAVFTGGEDALVQAWDADTAELIAEALPVPGPVLALAFETGTSSLVVGGTGVAVARPRLGE